MRLGGRKAGSLTVFLDTTLDEVLLRILVDEQSCCLFAFKLYDSRGEVVVESPEPKAYPSGFCVRSADDEVLLEIPPEEDGHLIYRLYNHSGNLLTSSDGKRTQIFGQLRMEGKSLAPSQVKAAAAS